MRTPSTGHERPVIVHTLVVGACHEDAVGIALRITASASYRAGLVAADPELERAAKFGSQPSTPAAVYVTGGHSDPARWTRFDDVVALPATDGSPIFRFRLAGDSPLPTAFRDAASGTHRILVVDTKTKSGESGPTVILFTPATNSS